MKKKLLFSTAGLATFASVLASCGGTGATGFISADCTVDVTDHSNITLKTYFPNFNCDSAKIRTGVLSTEIQKLTTYKVDFNQFSETGTDTEINSLLSLNEDCDLLKCAPTVFNNYVVDGYFTDLTEAIEKYGNIEVDEGLKFKDMFTEQEWEACTYQGKIFAIPERGHTSMTMSTLVWNTDHLKAVGITKIPETLGEFDDAVHALQAYYGAENKNYHCFGLAGTIAINNVIANAFGVPMNWYEDENGDLRNELESTEFKNYASYMSGLKREGIIVGDWTTHSESNAMNNFVKQYCSVYQGSYWNITALRNSVVASYTKPKTKVWHADEWKEYVNGTQKLCKVKDDALIGWRVGLRGDGTHNSANQEAYMTRDARDVGYFITVPASNASRAAYVVDWIARKNTKACTELVVAGVEGTHYEYCDSSDPDAIKLLRSENCYVKKLDAFNDDICGMEQFQTGVYGKAARVWWPLAECGFNAWSALFVDENDNEMTDRIIKDPFAVHPVMQEFSMYDLKAQNFVITKAQVLIQTESDEEFETEFANAVSRYHRDYYDNFSSVMNEWYRSTKTN